MPMLQLFPTKNSSHKQRDVPNNSVINMYSVKIIFTIRSRKKEAKRPQKIFSIRIKTSEISGKKMTPRYS